MCHGSSNAKSNGEFNCNGPGRAACRVMHVMPGGVLSGSALRVLVRALTFVASRPVSDPFGSIL